jgi:hypothetical protein
LVRAVRAVVLVEGVSDQRAVEALAHRRGRDLHAEGVAVVRWGTSARCRVHWTGSWPTCDAIGRLSLGNNWGMSSRKVRVAENEAASRDINEEIEEGQEGTPAGRYIRIVCECGQDQCDRLIAITLGEYERVRSDGRRFAVVPDHVLTDVERVVWETDRFVAVVKREGDAAEEASERDPRA